MATRYAVDNLKLPLDWQKTDSLEGAVSRATGIQRKRIQAAKIVREALDARKKPHIFFVVQVEFLADLQPGEKPPANVKPVKRSRLDVPDPKPAPVKKTDARHVIVVGSGPAGLFAAFALARAGVRTTLLERGKPVETRMRDIGQLRSKGVLLLESNICFGEGGAGTYTDGKLYTRIKHEYVRWVMRCIVDFGGPEEILVKAHPHLGTDKLVRIIKAMRARLLDLGVDVQFEARVDELIRREGKIAGVRLNGGRELPADAVVLGIGHSARELYAHMRDLGVAMEAKPFAVGVRSEHPQELINEAQYGKGDAHEILGAAAFRLTHQVADPLVGQRGIYSFCMCPGGFIVPSPTEAGHMAINGMSNANRSTAFANSGIVVQITPDDLIRAGYKEDPLMGIAFQRDLEMAAFKATNMPYAAPAMRISDFLARKPSGNLAPTLFRPAAEPYDLWELLPNWICEPLAEGLKNFDRKIRGFSGGEANILAVESRTSSPIRIVRGDDRQSVSLQGLYPVGEGAGYAGGIVSAAVDGLLSAEAILAS